MRGTHDRVLGSDSGPQGRRGLLCAGFVPTAACTPELRPSPKHIVGVLPLATLFLILHVHVYVLHVLVRYAHTRHPNAEHAFKTETQMPF